MNRRVRRAAVAAARKRNQSLNPEGMWWTQRPDPKDPDWALIEMRIPAPQMLPATYQGVAVVERLMRFCTGIMAGYEAAEQTRVEDQEQN